jgi:DNA-binding MarR family transcriptional regulator
MTADTGAPASSAAARAGTDTAAEPVAEPVADPDGADARDGDLAARLRLAVGRLNRRIRIDGHEATPPLQLSALVTVEQHGPLRLSELARREAVTAPTMSRVLSALDEQGLVIRTPDPHDARGVRIVLSERGAQRLDEVRNTRNALVARRLARLTPEQRRRLYDALPSLEALLVDDD